VMVGAEDHRDVADLLTLKTSVTSAEIGVTTPMTVPRIVVEVAVGVAVAESRIQDPALGLMIAIAVTAEVDPGPGLDPGGLPLATGAALAEMVAIELPWKQIFTVFMICTRRERRLHLCLL